MHVCQSEREGEREIPEKVYIMDIYVERPLQNLNTYAESQVTRARHRGFIPCETQEMTIDMLRFNRRVRAAELCERW